MAAKEFSAEIALEVHAQLGEGPVWDEQLQKLSFVDIVGHRVHTFSPATGEHHTFETGRPVGAVVLREDGGFVLAAHDSFFLAEPDGSLIEQFGEFSVDGEIVRFNDGKVDLKVAFTRGLCTTSRRGSSARSTCSRGTGA
jgi:sugar lactone lactonase YvrE